MRVVMETAHARTNMCVRGSHQSLSNAVYSSIHLAASAADNVSFLICTYRSNKYSLGEHLSITSLTWGFFNLQFYRLFGQTNNTRVCVCVSVFVHAITCRNGRIGYIRQWIGFLARFPAQSILSEISECRHNGAGVDSKQRDLRPPAMTVTSCTAPDVNEYLLIKSICHIRASISRANICIQLAHYMIRSHNDIANSRVAPNLPLIMHDFGNYLEIIFML